MIIIAGAYPAKWILERFIPNYLPATDVMFFLFASQGIHSIIKGIYVNKYKADGTQKKYLYQMIVMLILATVLNGLFYYLFRTMTSIAAATLMTNIVWLVYCEIENPDLRFNWKAYLSICVLLAVYLLSGNKCSSIVGCIIYISVGLFLSCTVMQETTRHIWGTFITPALDKIKRKAG